MLVPGGGGGGNDDDCCQLQLLAWIWRRILRRLGGVRRISILVGFRVLGFRLQFRV